MISGRSFLSLANLGGPGIVFTVVSYVIHYLVVNWVVGRVWDALFDPLVYCGLSFILACGYLWKMYNSGVFGRPPRTVGEGKDVLSWYTWLGVLLGTAIGLGRSGMGIQTARSLVISVIISDVWPVFLYLALLIPEPLKYIGNVEVVLLSRCAGFCILLFVIWVTHNVAMAAAVGVLEFLGVLVPAVAAISAYVVSLSEVFSVECNGEKTVSEADAVRRRTSARVVSKDSYTWVETGRGTWFEHYQGKIVNRRVMGYAIASAVVLVYATRWLAFDPCSDTVYEQANVKEFFVNDSFELNFIKHHGAWCGWPRTLREVATTTWV
jgi:hypothetical protein